MKKSSQVLACFAATLAGLLLAGEASGGTWNGIEPFKSRRPDLERILGKAISEGPSGELRFSVVGGSAVISFVDEKFAANKRLRPDTVGTVLQIVLQHENSTDTPESMGLNKNRAFDREELNGASVFRNLKEGVIYTFVNGTLKTTRYTFSVEQLSRARRGGR